MTIVIAVPLGLFVLWIVRFRYPPRGLPQALCYHKVSERFLFEGTWITPRRFAGHIDALRDRGYVFVDEDRYLDGLDRPPSDGAKRLLLTFDDAYEELTRVYHEILAPRGVPMLVFVVTDYVGRANTWDLALGRPPARHLDWEQIASLAARGVRFGSHGASHIDLRRAAPDVLAREVLVSKRALEVHTGAPVRSFSYPFGRYGAQAQEAVRAAGYRAAFSLYPPHANAHVDRRALRRNGVYIIDTPRTLMWKLERGPFYWIEEMKCRTINQVAALTPWLGSFASRRPRPDPDK